MPRIMLDVKLYSVKEVAEILGVSPITLNKYIKEGRMEAKLIGGKRYITEENVKSFLTGNK